MGRSRRKDLILIIAHIHLTFGAIKLKTEAASVGQTEEIGFAIGRGMASPLHTITEGIAQAIAALHHYAFGRRRLLEGRIEGIKAVGEIELTRLGIGYII